MYNNCTLPESVTYYACLDVCLSKPSKYQFSEFRNAVFLVSSPMASAKLDWRLSKIGLVPEQNFAVGLVPEDA